VKTAEAAEQLAALLNALEADGITVEIVREPGSDGHMLALERGMCATFEHDDVMWTYGHGRGPLGIRWLVAPK